MQKGNGNLENYAIEDFARQIIEEKQTIASLKKEIQLGCFDEETTLSLLNNLKILEKRLNKSLSFKEILLYTLLPSRKIHGLLNFFDPNVELKKGFKKRVNQFYVCSILGVICYLIIVMVCYIKFH